MKRIINDLINSDVNLIDTNVIEIEYLITGVYMIFVYNSISYIGTSIENYKENCDFQIKFMKHINKDKYCWQEKQDICWIPCQDIQKTIDPRNMNNNRMYKIHIICSYWKIISYYSK